MALLNCYECEGKVSSLARACPHCGAPVDNKLIHAVELGNTDGVSELLAKGADINAKDSSGFTALMKAAELGNPDIVKLLLQYQAD
jgi:uncharacterized protein